VFFKSIFQNLEFDPEIVENKFNSLFAKFGYEKQIADKLENFMDVTGYKPSYKQVQEKYKAILQGKKSQYFDIRIMFNAIELLTDIKPDSDLFYEVMDEKLFKKDIDDIENYALAFKIELTTQIIRFIYETYIKHHGILSTKLISKLHQMPDNDLMQEVYNKIIEQRHEKWITTLIILSRKTGIKPEFSRYQIDLIYEDFLLNRLYTKQKGHISIDGFIPIEPSPKLILKSALQIIDNEVNKFYENKFINWGKTIKEELQLLENAIKTKIEIPEQEIQIRYKQITKDRNPWALINLWGAFEIKPEIDERDIRAFLGSFIDKESSENLIPHLEKIFGIKLKISKKDVNSKIEHALNELDFDGIKTIQYIIGEKPDEKKLQEALVRKMEIEAMRCPWNVNDNYDHVWHQKIVELFTSFEITVPEDAIINIYAKLIDKDILYRATLENLYAISNVAIPVKLAQKACEKVLSPNFYYPYAKADLIKTICKLSDEEAINFSEIKIQNFYRNSVGYRQGSYEVQSIFELTKIEPKFDPVDINQLYKELIKKGDKKTMCSCQKITKVRLQPDKEIVFLINRKMDQFLKKVNSSERYDLCKFFIDLRNIEYWIEISNIVPEPREIQATYLFVLNNYTCCLDMINTISNVTKIKPHFSSEQIKAKGTEFLKSGDIQSFKRLLKYGEFSYDQCFIEQGYDSLLQNCLEYEHYEKCYYYKDEWLNEILEFKVLCGVSPNDDHLAELFFHLIESKYNCRDIDRINRAINVLKGFFEIEINESLAQKIYNVFVKNQKITYLTQLKERTKIVPKISDDILLQSVNKLLQEKNYKDLNLLKESLEFEKLEASVSIVQSIYEQFLSSDDFNTESFKEFFDLYLLTGIHVKCSQEQLLSINKKIDSKDWGYFFETLQVKPSEKVILDKYYQILIDDHHYNLIEDLNTIEKATKIKIPENTIKSAINVCLKNTNYKKLIAIIEAVGSDFELNPVIQLVYCKLFEEACANRVPGKKILSMIEYFFDILGVIPDKQTLEFGFQKLIGRFVYRYPYGASSFIKKDNEENVLWWDVLKNKFGMPTSECVQKTYYTQISLQNLNESDRLRNLKYIQNFTGINLNIDEILSIFETQEIQRDEIEEKIQCIYQKEFLAGRLENIEKFSRDWQLPFFVTKAQAQLLYAQILMKEQSKFDKQLSAKYKFLQKYSGYEPGQEIVKKKYYEVLKNRDFDEILEFRTLVGWKPGLSKEEVENFVLQGHMGKDIVASFWHPLFVNYFNSLIKQIGNKNFNDHKDEIFNLFINNEILLLQEDDFEVLKQNGLDILSLSEINFLKRSFCLKEISIKTNEGAQKIYNELRGDSSDWQDTEINRRFKMGATVFGYHRMLAYAKVGKRHDVKEF
jgi:hypothetical protein